LEALESRTHKRRSADRHAQQKARQLCRQVQRALNLALADHDVFVDEVTPAPDCGHLLVYILIGPERSVPEALEALRRDLPRLRAEVASAITRKRTPELSFVPAFSDGGGDV
jgi:ribosome-binding factor A